MAMNPITNEQEAFLTAVAARLNDAHPDISARLGFELGQRAYPELNILHSRKLSGEEMKILNTTAKKLLGDVPCRISFAPARNEQIRTDRFGGVTDSVPGTEISDVLHAGVENTMCEFLAKGNYTISRFERPALDGNREVLQFRFHDGMLPAPVRHAFGRFAGSERDNGFTLFQCTAAEMQKAINHEPSQARAFLIRHQPDLAKSLSIQAEAFNDCSMAR